MAENTITGLIPEIFEALDVVSRELTGLLPAVTMNTSAESAAVDQNIRHEVSPAGNVGDITPAMTVPDPTGQTSGYVDIVITKSRAANFGFIGDQQKALNTSVGYANSRAGKIAQAIRSVVNEVETDLAALHSTFSRSYGTAGTTPFATANDYTDATFVRKILKDNGGDIDPQLVLNTAAGATMLGKQAAADAAGGDTILRQGVLLDVTGMPLRESAQIKTHTKGSFTSGTLASLVRAAGVTVLTTTADYSSGIGAGDILTFAGDTNPYVVDSVTAAAITINGTGLVAGTTTGTKAITIIASSARNMCFARHALVLAARTPARPEEGDMAEDVMVITDPRSGLSLEFAMYKGYRKVRYEVGLAWGVKNVKEEHTALLLG